MYVIKLVSLLMIFEWFITQNPSHIDNYIKIETIILVLFQLLDRSYYERKNIQVINYK